MPYPVHEIARNRSDERQVDIDDAQTCQTR
jgi:hypothetical protein